MSFERPFLTGQSRVDPLVGIASMRKLIALALIALALAGGVAAYSLKKQTPAVACTGQNC